MTIVVDATNIGYGGGRTHLAELLGAMHPVQHEFSNIVVWAQRRTSQYLPRRPWISYRTNRLIEHSTFGRFVWQLLKSRRDVRQADVLFVPGGIHIGPSDLIVAMSQNMLPFEASERRRYGFGKERMRYWLVRLLQVATFRRARGVIFLSNYARSKVEENMELKHISTATIPHGIGSAFISPRGDRRPVPRAGVLRLLYVSAVDLYKHQWNVVRAVGELRRRGFNVVLDLVGKPVYGTARLHKVIDEVDRGQQVIRYHGEAPYETLAREYQRADIFVFASTCENLPIILLEAMASGLPVACSNAGVMPEVAGDAATYFDPLSVDSIVDALLPLVENPRLRSEMGARSIKRASTYTWPECARQTTSFLKSCVVPNRREDAPPDSHQQNASIAA